MTVIGEEYLARCTILFLRRVASIGSAPRQLDWLASAAWDWCDGMADRDMAERLQDLLQRIKIRKTGRPELTEWANMIQAAVTQPR